MDLKKFGLNPVFEWFTSIGIKIEKLNLDFEGLFRHDTKSPKDMILVVSMNDVHKHENHLEDNPAKGRYAQLSIIIPSKSHIMLTFNSNSTNLWFGTRIHERKWGTEKGSKVNETYKGYMAKHLYQKMDPIKKANGQLARQNIPRKSNVTLAYIIKESAQKYQPAAFN